MTPRILQPDRTVWRIEKAGRAAVLIDGAAFFAAVRGAFIKAQRSIIVVGWDIDSRTRLLGDREPSDGYPAEFGEFLIELTKRRPELKIHLLLWDYSLLYAGERELLPRLSLQWRMPEQVSLCLDDSVPFGSSQHQKIVVVDDALAMSGGLDLTIRRWDTSDHRLDNPLRTDPAGKSYRPFHDVQMMVDGDAARALALLARRRWCRANGGEPALEPVGDPWPETIAADFADVEIGIARTQPDYDGENGVREVEALFLESIDRAERTIYIENQFVTSSLIARRLARRLRRRPHLEILIVAPRSHDSFIERRTMRNGRIRFWRALRKAGGHRVRLLYPSVEQGEHETDTMIHSKIMVIDDVMLRVGSANLNNRSMGADTECDLVVEARQGADGEGERAAITAVRNRLIGEHCGVSADEVARVLAQCGSLVETTDRLTARGHSLRPIDDGKPDGGGFLHLAERIADPARPLRLGRAIGRAWRRLAPGRSGATPGMAIGVAALLLLALTLAWRFTGLAQLAAPQQVGELLAGSAGEPWGFLLVLAGFLIGGAIAFPVTIMILATAAVFGPWLGMLYAAGGAITSALLMYSVGARFGQDALERLLGERGKRVAARLRRRGVLAVVAIRVLPVAPFTLINLAAGAGSISLADFVLGTAIGMGPGLVVMSLMGERVVEVIADPSAGQIALLVLCVAGWIALSFAAQALVSRLAGRSRDRAS